METQDLRGVLSRRKGIFSSWVKHTYVKKDSTLLEYKLGANYFSAEPLQVIDLTDALIEDAHLITGEAGSFAIHCAHGKTFFFLAPTLEEKDRWLRHLTSSSSSSSSSSFSSSSISASPAPSQSGFRNPLPTSSSASSSSGQVRFSGSESSFDRASQEEIEAEMPPQISVEGHITQEELESMMPVLNYLESFTDAVVVGNINGVIVSINSAAEKLFQVSKAEVQGEPLTILMPEPYKSQHDSYLFRHEKFGSEKLIGKTRNLKGERRGETFDLQISLGKLPVKGQFIATLREIDPSLAKRTEYAD